MDESSQTLDKRHFARIPFDAKVTLHLKSAEKVIDYTGHLLDISLKGILVSTESSNLPPASLVGANGNIEIELSSAEVVLFAEAEVTRCEENHIALKITMMPIETAEHLRKLVQLNLGDEELLQRELAALIHE